jgi:hypothetical protein
VERASLAEHHSYRQQAFNSSSSSCSNVMEDSHDALLTMLCFTLLLLPAVRHWPHHQGGWLCVQGCLHGARWLGPDPSVPMVTAPCEKNTYGDSVDCAAVANARCTACPADMFTMDTLESRARNDGELYTSESACLVKPGWGTTSTTPQECPVGTV